MTNDVKIIMALCLCFLSLSYTVDLASTVYRELNKKWTVM